MYKSADTKCINIYLDNWFIIMNLPLFDLQTRESINLELPKDKPSLLILFSMKDVLMMRETNKDLADNSFNPIGIYVGDEISKASAFSKKEPRMMKIYWGGSNLTEWKRQGANESPWIIILKNSETVLSLKPASIGKPLIRNLKRRLNSTQSRSLTPTPKQSATPEPKITIQQEKIEEMEKLAKQNQEDIKALKECLAEKDKVLKEIMDKLESFKGAVKLRRSPKLEEEENPYAAEDEEYWKKSPLYEDHKKLWIYSISTGGRTPSSSTRSTFDVKPPNRLRNNKSLERSRKSPFSHVGDSIVTPKRLR
ncbi:unnamed protein product [Blepharisma stoltei]|uniref:Uncharacterized protein n=1 Tax=Blepharisma stoltei TaxID=1481888 RepID=A0AAU9JT79_9CILI|nr:unnamed protein product [Blepharisma stoltei]